MKKATLNAKVEHVNETEAMFKESNSAVVVDYLGLSVAEVSELRRNLHNAGAELRVIKNNIIRRAADQCGYEGIQDHLTGPSAVAFSKDATSGPKILFDFAKGNDKLEIKAGIVEGKYYEPKELKVLASLPNKEGMISMLLSVLQAPIRNLGCAIKAVAEKEEA